MAALDTVARLTQEIQSEAGPSRLPLVHSHVLGHPLLAAGLPTSTELAAQISVLQAQYERDQQRAESAKEEVDRQINDARYKVSQYQLSLDALPAQLEALEDDMDALVTSLGSDDPDSLPTCLKRDQDTLQAFKKAEAYFAILAKARSLWEATSASEAQSPGAAQTLDSLADLANLSNHAQMLAAEGSDSSISLEIITFLHNKVRETYHGIARSRTVALREALSDAGWPPLAPEQAEAQGKEVTHPASVLGAKPVKNAWSALTSLQIVAWLLKLAPKPSTIREGEHESIPSPGSEPYVPLLATAVLVEPYLLRFKYHFDSERSTNRLDKPEWYLNHMSGLVKSLQPLFVSGISEGLVPSLSKPSFRRYGKLAYSCGETDLLHVLLQPLQAKLKTSVPLLISNSDSALLSHTVSSLIEFDDELVHSIPHHCPYVPLKLSDDVLNSQDWFTAWVRGERTASLDNLESILEDGNAWTIGTEDSDGVDDDDGEAEGEPRAGTWAAASLSSSGRKTTRSSRALVRLLEGLTRAYTPLPELSQRLQFLSEIQLPLLRTYSQRLTRSLDAFESLSSAFARAIPGGMTDTSTGLPLGDQAMVRGLRGLSRLLKAYVSASHMAATLAQWQESGFFVEMSHDLLASENGRALLKQQRDEAEDRELDAESLGSLIRRGLRGSRQDQQQATSKAFGSVDFEGIWDEPLQRFTALASRAREGLKKLVVSEVNEGLRDYSLQSWTDSQSLLSDVASGDPSDAAGLAEVESPTPSLLPALTAFHMHLSHLLPVVEAPEATTIYRAICREISAIVVQRVVIAGGSKRFTQSGGERFGLDWERGWRGVLISLQKQEQASQGASSSSLGSSISKMGLNPDHPWRYLRDVATLLALPGQSTHGNNASSKTPGESHGWTLARATLLLWSTETGDEMQLTDWQRMRRELGLTSSELREGGESARQRAKEVLRRRVDCFR